MPALALARIAKRHHQEIDCRAEHEQGGRDQRRRREFRHGEFLMIAMYGPSPVRVLRHRSFAGGAAGRGRLVRVRPRQSISWWCAFAMRAKANAGMVQIFSTSGFAIVMAGLAAVLLHAGLIRQHHPFLARGKTISLGGIYLPERQLMGRAGIDTGVRRAVFFIHRRTSAARWKRPGATNGAVALVGIDKKPGVRARLGPGAALSALPARSWRCSSMVYPDVGGVLRADRLCHGRAWRLRQRVRRLAGASSWAGRGDDGAGAAALAEIRRIYAVYLLVVFVRARAGLFGSI